MSKKLKIVFLLQSIIFANWAISKLVAALSQESIKNINDVYDRIILVEPNCLLDESLDGTRESLKFWNRV
jgi:hypothetical protein